MGNFRLNMKIFTTAALLFGATSAEFLFETKLPQVPNKFMKKVNSVSADPGAANDSQAICHLDFHFDPSCGDISLLKVVPVSGVCNDNSEFKLPVKSFRSSCTYEMQTDEVWYNSTTFDGKPDGVHEYKRDKPCAPTKEPWHSPTLLLYATYKGTDDPPAQLEK